MAICPNGYWFKASVVDSLVGWPSPQEKGSCTLPPRLHPPYSKGKVRGKPHPLQKRQPLGEPSLKMLSPPSVKHKNVELRELARLASPLPTAGATLCCILAVVGFKLPTAQPLHAPQEWVFPLPPPVVLYIRNLSRSPPSLPLGDCFHLST